MTLAEALRVLYAAGRVGNAGPGEVAWRYLDEVGLDDVAHFAGERDPMVLGCLLALLREATGHDWLCIVPAKQLGAWGFAVQRISGQRWPCSEWFESESAALVAALVAREVRDAG